jgi:2-C-methyl-D-erythritol 4-phosphate cytidylyltransferase
MTATSEFRIEDLIDDVTVILLAGGSGERLGGARPKAFVGLAGEVMLAHSLRSFEAHEAVDAIVLVVPEDWEGPAEALVDDLGCDRVSAIVVGGSSRAASVQAGLACVPARRGTAVLVHDAARPLVSADVVDRVLAPLAEGFDAVVPVIAVPDTIKQLADDDSMVVAVTPPRNLLRSAQTPQACRATALHEALAHARDEELAGMTDCSDAVARIGGAVVAVPGDERLHKITTRADLGLVESWLARDTGAHEADEVPDVEVLAGEEDVEDLEPLDSDDLAGFEPNADDGSDVVAGHEVEI